LEVFKLQTNLDLASKKEEFKELRDYMNSLKGTQGVLMQTLHKAQEIFGYLPIEVQKFISEELDIPLAEIYGVATFYTRFSINPKGKHKIGVCLGTACYVKGSQNVMNELQKELNIKVGETTEDGLFTLDATRCLGGCGLAPVMTIDEDVYAKLDPSKISGIMAKYKE
jgi:NADH:ubiquinone oxidoreductase subunit E